MSPKSFREGGTVQQEASHSLVLIISLKFLNQRAGEMAQQLRALAVLPEDSGSIPSTHMAAHACL